MQRADKEAVRVMSVFILVMACTQCFLLWVSHWSIALIVTGLISFFAVSLYIALSHARPNGGSKGPRTSAYINPMLIVFSLILCSLWLICFLMEILFPLRVVIIPLGLIVLFVLGRFLYAYINTATFWGNNYSICNFQLESRVNNIIHISGISLRNQTSGFSMDIDVSNLFPNTYIPRGTDEITFGYRSANANKTTWMESSFDYGLCNEKENYVFDLCFWITRKSISPIKLILLSENKIELYIDNHLIKTISLD